MNVCVILPSLAEICEPERIVTDCKTGAGVPGTETHSNQDLILFDPYYLNQQNNVPEQQSPPSVASSLFSNKFLDRLDGLPTQHSDETVCNDAPLFMIDLLL